MECKGLTGLIFGHNFESIFNEGPPAQEIKSADGPNGIKAIEALKPKTYVHSVCKRCGLTTEGER